MCFIALGHPQTRASITYTSLFFGHAEGEKEAVKMYEQLVSDGIPVAKLVTLV